MPSSDPTTPDSTANSPEETESFGDLLKQYEKEHRRPKDESRQLEGTVIKVSDDTVYVDIGYKSEGILPTAALHGQAVKPGDKLLVSVKGRDPEGYYELSRTKVSVPKDWSALEKAFNEKSTIMGTVTGAIKGGVTVDIGVRAFMPAARSATKDAAEREKRGGSDIKCRIIKIDVPFDVTAARAAIGSKPTLQTYQKVMTLAPGSPWAICITPPPHQVLFSADAYPGRLYKLSLDGKMLGWLGQTGKQLKQFGWVHEIACPSENEVYVAELLNWRVQKLILHPKR